MLSSARMKSPLFWLKLSGLLAIVAFGAAVRISGFSNGDPGFDDAWVILSTKVGLGSAVHMVDTTPLFTLGIRGWMGFHPGSLWWAQLPAFALGLGAIVAVFSLIRYFRIWWPLAFLGALVVASSPVVINYSTRVKQYNLDIILACAVLWLFERWRQSASRRDAAVLAATGSLSLLISATTSTVIAPMCAIAVLCALKERRRVRDVAIVIGAVGTTFVVDYVVWLGHLSHGLHVGWTNRGYLLGFKSVHLFAFALQNMGSEFFHWMIGVPTGHPPDPSKAITPAGIIIAVMAAVLLVTLVWPTTRSLIRRSSQLPPALGVAATSLVFAVVLALAGVSPFGGGRTDEVIYPGLLLLMTGLVAKFAVTAKKVGSNFLVIGVVVAASGCVTVGVLNRAHYPVINLRSLYAQFHSQVKPTDLIVVDPWMTFTWADLSLSKTEVAFNKTFFDWSQGFHVVSLESHVIISDQYFFPNVTYTLLGDYMKLHPARIWYVGETENSPLPHAAPVSLLLPTRNLAYLLARGWVPTTTVYQSTHTMALLLRYVAPPR